MFNLVVGVVIGLVVAVVVPPVFTWVKAQLAKI